MISVVYLYNMRLKVYYLLCLRPCQLHQQLQRGQADPENIKPQYQGQQSQHVNLKSIPKGKGIISNV